MGNGGQARIRLRHRARVIFPRFPSADFVGDRVVFNIKGNTYRLIVAVYFPGRIMFIEFVGTHAEFDESDAATVSYTR